MNVKRILAIILALIPGTDLALEETLETTFEGSTESSTQSQKIQIARMVKRDAEMYLAGSSMTRELRLKLERLQADHPELDSDELVECVLEKVDRTLVKAGASAGRERSSR